MDDFPEGYDMYDHHKSRDDGTVRHDIYLFGERQTFSIKNFC